MADVNGDAICTDHCQRKREEIYGSAEYKQQKMGLLLAPMPNRSSRQDRFPSWLQWEYIMVTAKACIPLSPMLSDMCSVPSYDYQLCSSHCKDFQLIEAFGDGRAS